MDLQQIGASHPRIKQVLDVINNTTPNRHRLFVAEGLWAHNVLLATDLPIDTFFWCPEAAYSDEAQLRARQAAERAERAYRISPKTLARVAERDKPDGLLSIARMHIWEPDEIVLPDRAIALVADGVEIPGNLGTLIRTMDACAASVLILTNRRTRMTHPKVIRGSHGTNLTMPSIEFGTPDEAMAWLDSEGFQIYLADTDEAAGYRDVAYAPRSALVVGAERFGISPPWYAHGAPRVAVPMYGSADSLNVSISAAVLLYEIRAQLGPPPSG
jgi:TrmH family RNA methyltransferase